MSINTITQLMWYASFNPSFIASLLLLYNLPDGLILPGSRKIAFIVLVQPSEALSGIRDDITLIDLWVVRLHFYHLHVLFDYLVVLGTASAKVEVCACSHAIHLACTTSGPWLGGWTHLWGIWSEILNGLRFGFLSLIVSLFSQVLLFVVFGVEVNNEFSVWLFAAILDLIVSFLFLVFGGILVQSNEFVFGGLFLQSWDIYALIEYEILRVVDLLVCWLLSLQFGIIWLCLFLHRDVDNIRDIDLAGFDQFSLVDELLCCHCGVVELYEENPSHHWPCQT